MRKNHTKHNALMRSRRHRRIRGGMRGTARRPRLSVFRSAKHLTLQLVDDAKGNTLVGLTDQEIKKSGGKGSRVKRAREAGRLLAQKALAEGISRVVFDRGGYRYHGRVQAAAEGAREGGLKF